MERKLICGTMDKNYGALLRALIGLVDVTPYVFDGAEDELDKLINLLSEEEQKIIKFGFGLEDKTIKNCSIVAKELSTDNHQYNVSKINKILHLALRRINYINRLGKDFKDYGSDEYYTYRFDKEKIMAELPHALKWSREFDKKNYTKKSERTETYEMVYDKLIFSNEPTEDPETVIRTLKK